MPLPTATKRRCAIVSGGTYGIGRRIVLELATRGWPVVAFGVEAQQPGSLARAGIRATRDALAEAGVSADLLEADVSSAADVGRVVRHAVRAHGGIGAVVNNAAVRPTGSVLETDEASFDRVMAVNLKGPFLLARAALPHLRDGGGGVIVNLGSGAAQGRPGLAAYAASKGGLHALTLALAHDHAADRVRVYLVVPGPGTPSGMVEAMQVGTTEPSEPSEGRTSPADVARVVAFLLSSDAAPPTGTRIDVAGFSFPADGA